MCCWDGLGFGRCQLTYISFPNLSPSYHSVWWLGLRKDAVCSLGPTIIGKKLLSFAPALFCCSLAHVPWPPGKNSWISLKFNLSWYHLCWILGRIASSRSSLIKNRFRLECSECSKITIYKVCPLGTCFPGPSVPSLPSSTHLPEISQAACSISCWILRWVCVPVSGAGPLPSPQVPTLRPSVWVTSQSAMEPSPALAWLLLLSLLADCLKAAQSRDFTVKDIIYLHPSSKTIFCLFSWLKKKNASFLARKELKHVQGKAAWMQGRQWVI